MKTLINFALWLVVVSFLGLLFLGCTDQDREGMGLKNPSFRVGYTGRVSPGFISSDEFQLRIFHKYPGVLKNGIVRVTVVGDAVAGGQKTKTWSFEQWQPNETAAQALVYELVRDDNVNLTIHINIKAKNGSFETKTRWLVDAWASNK